MIIVYTSDNSIAGETPPDITKEGGGATPGPKVLRPCPLVSISSSPLKNKMANLGSNYTITLNGYLLVDGGSPGIKSPDVPANKAQFSDVYNPKPTGQVALESAVGSLIKQQHELRSLFAVEGRRVEILSITGNEPAVIFYPRLESINFEEGPWTNYCRYTITLSADLMFDPEEKIITDSLGYLNFEPSGEQTLHSKNHTSTSHVARKTLTEFTKEHGGFVEDFSESWSLEPEEGNGNTVNPFIAPAENIIRSYKLTRTINATGRTIYGPGDAGNNSIRYEGWQQAKDFIRKKLFGDKDTNPQNNSISQYDQYPKLNFDGAFSKHFINLTQDKFGGYNHFRTESIDKTNGSYSVTDTWLLSSGTAYENYNVSLSSSSDSSLITVTIDGSIKGLTSIPSSGNIYVGNTVGAPPFNTPYENAIRKYREISDSGNFGLVSHAWRRASNVVGEFLNPAPLSTSVGSNEFTGEITYNVVYNTRPLNFISGSLSESISIQDTYPGDVFATIPVIGRSTGPVMQYLGTRTEYQRSVTIEFTFGTIYGGTQRQQLILSKPSLNEPTRTTLNNLISQLSPAREPGIRKYFLSPPNESWDPVEKRYSITLNWTYELAY